MSKNASFCSARRPALLAGSAMLALLITATAAQAQNGGATASGPRALAHQQSLRDGVVVADASGIGIGATAGDIDRSELTLFADTILVTGKGNAATLALDAAGNGDGGYRAAATVAGPNSASATGTQVIANRQSIDARSVSGNIVGSHMAVAAGRMSASKLTLSNNAQDAAATGNDLTAALRANEGGSGLASSQMLNVREGLAARARGGYSVTTGALTSSRVEASGNLDRAVAAGNSARSALSLEAPLLTLDERTDTASIVPAEGDVLVNGAMAASVVQSASGILKAVLFEDGDKPTLATLVQGGATSSSIASDDNALTAAARGNVSATAGSVIAASIEQADGQTGSPSPIATIATAQKSEGLDVRAFAAGDIRVSVDGDVSGSDISDSRNLVRTIAAANQSESDLSLAAGATDADRGRGLATVDAAGDTRTDAGMAVHSVQDYGSSAVLASHTARIEVEMTGTAAGARIGVEDNSDLAAATGNDATSRLTVDAGTLGTSLALNSVQTGNGDVLANSGSREVRGAFGIIAGESASNTRLTVRGNSHLASAIGNAGTNGIDVTAGTMRGTADGRTVSGAMSGTYDASADVALASNQKLGEPTNEGGLIPTIHGQVFTSTGVRMNGGAGSALAVEDNLQQATALGNTVANTLSVSAIGLGQAGDEIGTSLASSQYGQANVDAMSDAALHGSQAGATNSISGNANAALAVINDADNALFVDAVTAFGARVSEAASDGFGPPVARGGHVLSNQQFAIGSANAVVTTAILGSEPAGGEGRTDRVTGNRTSGEASANRALNRVAANTIDGPFSAGLANTQVNAAATQVAATASTSVPLGSAERGPDIAIEGNAVSALARGNAAENGIAMSAGAPSPAASGQASADRFGAQASGGAALLNVQTNVAPVTASALGASAILPLNAGALDTGRVSIGGGSVSATSYGNTATNSVSVSGLSAPSAAIANHQTNSGSVQAVVTGGRFDATPGSLGAGNFSMFGNQLSATAIGNQVSSAITGLR